MVTSMNYGLNSSLRKSGPGKGIVFAVIGCLWFAVNLLPHAHAQDPGFTINPGLNDAWYNPATNGQGFLISVFPENKQLFLAWFTYDTERPPEDTPSMLGEPRHRWLTAQGPYDGDTANLVIYVTKGGVFDAADPAPMDPAPDGTITLSFADCTQGILDYDITSLGLSGEIPIQRIVPDNVTLCEALLAQIIADSQPPEPEGLEGITAAHNAVRATVDVPPLTWDDDLAAIAQAWADGCVNNEPPDSLIDHNPGRSENYPGYVGENIYGSSGTPTPQRAVDAWASEVDDYDYDSNSCSGVCGHYTQIVWETTERVGCGISQCEGLTNGGTIVCNYSPGGNDGGRPY